MRLNALLKSKAFGNSIKYKVICNGELKDGEQFKVQAGKWENEDTYWGPDFLLKMLKEKGLKGEVEYVKK